MRWHIKALRGCNVCANSFIALSASCRVRSSRSPRRRLSASLLHHGPPPATLRPMTYHPRDNATAHGPRDNVPPPATQLPRRSPDNVAGAPEPSSRRPHTPTPSPALLSARLPTGRGSQVSPRRVRATQHRTRPPPTRQRRHTRPTQQPSHEAPTQRHPQRRSTTQRHTGARAEHQGAT